MANTRYLESDWLQGFMCTYVVHYFLPTYVSTDLGIYVNMYITICCVTRLCLVRRQTAYSDSAEYTFQCGFKVACKFHHSHHQTS